MSSIYMQAKHDMLDAFDAWYLDYFPKRTYTGREYAEAKSALHAAWIASQAAKEKLIAIRKKRMAAAGELLNTGAITAKQAQKLCEITESKYNEERIAIQKRWEYLRDTLG